MKEQGEITTMKPVKLATEYGRIEPGILEELLRRHEIPYYTEKKGSGLYRDIYFGYSSDGVDFYVDESDFERARELADIFETDMEVLKDESEPEAEVLTAEESDEDESTTFFNKERIKIIILLVILAILLPRLIFYIGSNPFQ